MGLLHEGRKLSAVRPTPIPPTLPGLDLHDIQFNLRELATHLRTKTGEGKPKRRYCL